MRASIAGALWDAKMVDLRADDEGRLAVEAVEVKRGTLVMTQGRFLRSDWLADPSALARKLARCGRHSGVHRKADGGGWGEHVVSCGSPACPWCAAGKAQSAQDRYKPQAKALLASGDYIAVNITFTQRVAPLDPEQPVVRGYNEHEGHGYAVQGAGLLEELDRWSDAFHKMRDSRRWRNFWKRSTAAGVMGLEWTGRNRARQLRWNVHGHGLFIVPRAELEGPEGGFWVDEEGEVQGEWRDAVATSWCEFADAQPEGMSVKFVADSGTQEAEVDRALAEVLKYPFKPASLTPAQIAESLAATKGRKLARPLGAWSPQSNAARAVRYLAELVKAGEVDEVDRLTPEWLHYGGMSGPDLRALAEARVQALEPRAHQVYRQARKLVVVSQLVNGEWVEEMHAPGRELDEVVAMGGLCLGERWESRVGHRKDPCGVRWVPLYVEDLVGAEPEQLTALEDGELVPLELEEADAILEALAQWEDRESVG